jgi:hypothetical protein
MLRWMAPFLSFTAEGSVEAVRRFGIDLLRDLCGNSVRPDEALLEKWTRIRQPPVTS